MLCFGIAVTVISYDTDTIIEYLVTEYSYLYIYICIYVYMYICITGCNNRVIDFKYILWVILTVGEVRRDCIIISETAVAGEELRVGQFWGLLFF